MSEELKNILPSLLEDDTLSASDISAKIIKMQMNKIKIIKMLILIYQIM